MRCERQFFWLQGLISPRCLYFKRFFCATLICCGSVSDCVSVRLSGRPSQVGALPKRTRHRADRSSRWHFAFGVCCHSNEIHTPIANPPNSAQLQSTPYHFPKLHPGPCSSVGMRRRTARHTHTGTHMHVTITHFATATPHAKCNKRKIAQTTQHDSPGTLVFTAWRHASAVYGVVVCLSVCQSITSRCSTETVKRRIT